MARQAQNQTDQTDQPSDDDVRKQAEQAIGDADQSGGDAFGATQDPSPALQADVVATIVTQSGTITDVPSARLSKDEVKRLNGE